MMRWREWRRRHPNTLVLEKPAGRGRRDSYATYHASDRIGVTGLTRPAPGSLDPKTRVAGFRTADAAFAVTLDRLRPGVVQVTTAAGLDLVIAATADGSGVRVHRAAPYRFEVVTEAGRRVLRDAATGSTWDPFDGRAVAGPLARRTLDELPVTLSYWFAWRAFFPRAVIVR